MEAGQSTSIGEQVVRYGEMRKERKARVGAIQPEQITKRDSSGGDVMG